jgi:hypothetical protein
VKAAGEEPTSVITEDRGAAGECHRRRFERTHGRGQFEQEAATLQRSDQASGGDDRCRRIRADSRDQQARQDQVGTRREVSLVRVLSDAERLPGDLQVARDAAQTARSKFYNVNQEENKPMNMEIDETYVKCEVDDTKQKARDVIAGFLVIAKFVEEDNKINNLINELWLNKLSICGKHDLGTLLHAISVLSDELLAWAKTPALEGTVSR